MKKIKIFCICLLLLGFMAESAVAQISYCKDILEPGNPPEVGTCDIIGGPCTTDVDCAGGTLACLFSSLKTWDETRSMDVGETVEMDIWLNDVPEPMLTAGFYITYDPTLVNITNIIPYDTDNGGYWDPEEPFSPEPGIWKVDLLNLSCVAPDGDGDIALAQVVFERLEEEPFDITIQTIPEFATVIGCEGNNYDAQIMPNTVSITKWISYCKGLADFDQDVDGSDAFQFKQHFGRSPLGNPCPPDGPAPVPRTGQTTSYNTSDDGFLEKGVAWPNPRFEDNGDGTVTDNLTGLMWMKDISFCNAGASGQWDSSFACASLANQDLGTFGFNDWRVPNARELHSLLDYGQSSPALPVDHPFQNVGASTDPAFWTATTSDYTTADAFVCSVNKDHNLVARSKTSYNYRTWLVRGGHN